MGGSEFQREWEISNNVKTPKFWSQRFIVVPEGFIVSDSMGKIVEYWLDF